MAKRVLWSQEEWKHCLACFSKSDSVEEAIEEFQEAYPTRSASSVLSRFKTSGMEGTPSDYLRTAEFDPEQFAKNQREQHKIGLIEEVQKKELKDYRKRQAVIDLILDRVEAEVLSLPKPEKLKAPKISKDKQNYELVLPVSDVQIGEFIDPHQLSGLGEYSFEIFEKRVKIWQEHALKFITEMQAKGNVTRLHIPFIGDIVEGMEIFSSQAFHIDSGLVKQTVHGAIIFSKAIAEIVLAVGNIPIVIKHVAGNHGRIGRKGAIPYADNWDRVLGFFMQGHLAKFPNITVEIPEEWFIFQNILGWHFHLSHGDDINSWMSLPAYGMVRAHARDSIMLHTPLDYYIIGHHHTLSTIQNGYGEVICNGNWVGSNEFSGKILKLFNRPCQLMFSVTAEYGITDRYVCYFETKEEITERMHKYNPSLDLKKKKS